VKTIASRRNPLVERFRAVADAGRSADLILLDGVHLIEEAIGSRVPIAVLAVTPRALAVPRVRHLVEQLDRATGDVYSVPDALLRAMSPVRAPSGLVALARRPRWTLEQATAPAPPLLVVATDVQDPGNAGAIARSAEAGGATGVVFCGASADPFGWKALRGSMGSSLRLPVVEADLPDVLEAVHRAGSRVLATVPRGGTSMFATDLRQGVAVLLGGEGPGLSEDVIARADARISIPMRGGGESLNVAVAAALLVYEAGRQRGWGRT
jgi:TrmH family RNA methyltransferase